MTYHELPVRIYYEDTDAGGIVYHANYLRFGERARSEMMRDAGYKNVDFVDETGLMFVVRHIDIDYFLPAVLDDFLTVKTSVLKIGGASATLRHDIMRGEDILSSLQVVLVCVTQDKRQAAKMPDRLRKALSHYKIDEKE